VQTQIPCANDKRADSCGNDNKKIRRLSGFGG
jgi:hypothetical protein